AYGDMGLAVDETDLCFTADEARDAARGARVAVREHELNKILALTRGWPAALTFALRSSLRSSDLQHLELQTREKIYRYLAEQVFVSLAADERDLLFLASFLRDIDVNVLRSAGIHNAEPIVEALRQRVAFIYKEGEGVFRCHDLFRDFLQYELSRRGEEAYRGAQLRAARALRESGRDALALALCADAKATQETLEIIERQGSELIEHGHGDVVSRATSSLPKELQNSNPSVLAIRASAEMTAGRFDSAEHLYKRAIALSDDATFKASAAIQLLVLLANQNRDDLELFAPLLTSDKLPHDLRTEAISALASAHALAKHDEIAVRLIRDASQAIDCCKSDNARVRSLQRIGFASFYVGDWRTARRASVECARQAEHLGYYILASRAYSVLASTEMVSDEDIIKTLAYTEKAAACAAKAGDRLGRQTALFQMYEIEARRGNVERVQQLESELANMQTSDSLRLALIFPLRALRVAWDGRFSESHRLSSGVIENQVFAAVRALRRAECALYLAADGRREAALRFIDTALDEANALAIQSFDQKRHQQISKLLCALALGVLKRTTTAIRLAHSAVNGSTEPHMDAFKTAIISACHLIKGVAHEPALVTSLSHLKRFEYGGYALLIEAICKCNRQESDDSCALTTSELAILKALSDGLSTKIIAQETNRSPHTVRAHVRSAISKLGCSGRTEALAVARRAGLVP
ncbi:MAG: hypothetical protein JO135_03400, partial [Candidatus Eremiobacteraeota bacterium]|nr:hypothetical protein [Candidatus Eremiobacteraeota bacterium]